MTLASFLIIDLSFGAFKRLRNEFPLVHDFQKQVLVSIEEAASMSVEFDLRPAVLNAAMNVLLMELVCHLAQQSLLGSLHSVQLYYLERLGKQRVPSEIVDCAINHSVLFPLHAQVFHCLEVAGHGDLILAVQDSPLDHVSLLLLPLLTF